MYNQYPHTDFHALNLDWILEQVKNAVETATGTAADQKALREFVENYFANLDVQQEINTKLDNMAADGSLATATQGIISQVVAAWLTSHITPTSPPVDSSLTVAGAAADAKVTGDALAFESLYGSLNLIRPINTKDKTQSGVAVSWNDLKATVSGTATAQDHYDLYRDKTSLPVGMVAGSSYHLKYDATSVPVRLYYADAGGEVNQIVSTTKDAVFTLPENAVGFIAIFFFASGHVYNETVAAPYVYGGVANLALAEELKTHAPSYQNAIIGLYHGGPSITYDGDSKTYHVAIDSAVRLVWNNYSAYPPNRITENYDVPHGYILAYLIKSNNFAVISTDKADMAGVSEPFVICLQNNNGNLSGQWARHYTDARMEKRMDTLLPTAMPDYYNAYMNERCDTINNLGLSLSRHSGRLIWITDYHAESNANNSPSLINYLMHHTGLRHVAFGGDAINNDNTPIGAYTKLANFVGKFAPVATIGKVRYITGNHEYNNPSGDPELMDKMLTAGALYQLFNGGQDDIIPIPDTNSFYVDNAADRIRYYYIDCNYQSSITTETRVGVAQSFLTVPEGYAVLLCSHKGLTNDNSEIYSRMQHIMQYATAMNDGTSTTINFTDIGPVTIDYTGHARTLIGALTGHTHIDGMVMYDGRFPVIATACDAYAAQTSHTERVKGTTLEQAFDVVQVDVQGRKIYLTRIGAGEDRVYSFGQTV